MAEQDDSKTEEPKSDSTESATVTDADDSSTDAFKKGVGLLWKAARAAANEIKREVEKGGVRESLERAGHDLEIAAQEAAKAVEDFIERAGPKSPNPDYTDKWPPDQGGKVDDKADAKLVDADIPEDGGKTDSGERRDMRIQLDDD